MIFEEQGVRIVLSAPEAAAIGDFAIEYWGPPGLGFLQARALGVPACGPAPASGG